MRTLHKVLAGTGWRIVFAALAITLLLPLRARADLGTPTVTAVAFLERNQIKIVILGAIFLVETALVVGLVTIGRKRRAIQRSLDESDRLKGAILSSLPAHIAVLDRQGTIIAVNDAWSDFARGNGLTSNAAGAGTNYIDVCARAARLGAPYAAEALGAIQAACRGERCGPQIEYRCDGPGQERWFVMTATPLRRSSGGAVVTHSDITERKRIELAVRESEDRFRRLADALPVAVWMAEPDKLCSYFNRPWLDMTGRSLEIEKGFGWIVGVHPDDRERCVDTYVRAFDRREPFSMEFRIRRYDGEYRWLLDSGQPRYGADGTFQGYVGGCIDITERLEAEQGLHHLSRRLIVAQEEERRRIARELHDHLNQQLALLAIDLQQLVMTPPASGTLPTRLDELWRRTNEISSEVHGLSHRLHPSKLEALGLVATIRGHCRDISRHGIVAHFSEREAPTGIPADVSLCLFRIVEEALSNVVRHSQAPEAYVTLEEVDGEIILRVVDAGRGFEYASTPEQAGLGLVSMRERLRSVGGTLKIASAPGQGSLIEARVPRSPTERSAFEPEMVHESLADLPLGRLDSPRSFRSIH